MTGPAPAAPEAGWYQQDAGSPEHRWWDGTAWTAFRTHAAPRPGARHQPPLPAGTSTGTWMNWALVLLQLLSIPAAIPLLLNLSDLLQRTTAGHVAPEVPAGFLLALGLQQLIGWLILAATVVLAYADWRALRQRGIARPFHWAWSFLSVVYVVGRNVVVHNRTGQGLAPLWVFIGVYIAGTLAFLALFGFAFAHLAGELPDAR